MAFGRKKKVASEVQIDQGNVAMLATEALARARSMQVALLVRLTFTAPVLMHRWSNKALEQMLGKMTGHTVLRTEKDLTEDFNNSWYRNENGVPAMPCRIIKAAIVNGAVATNDLVSKADLKRELRVVGYTAPIVMKGELEKDVRLVKNQMTPDVRARAVVPAGSYVDIVLRFSPSLGPDKVMAATEAAGSAIGLCDWRPDKGGEFGTFEVSVPDQNEKAIAACIKACAVPEEKYTIPPHMMRALSKIPHGDLKDGARKVKGLIEHVNGQKKTARSRSVEA
jgi:hypothetical protein